MSAPPKARRGSHHLEITSPQDDSRAAQGDRSASQDDVYRTETAEDEARDTDELRNAALQDDPHDLTAICAVPDGSGRATRRSTLPMSKLARGDRQRTAYRSSMSHRRRSPAHRRRSPAQPALSSLDALASPERDPTLMMTRSVSPSRSQRRATLAADTAPLHDDGNTEISLDEIFYSTARFDGEIFTCAPHLLRPRRGDRRQPSRAFVKASAPSRASDLRHRDLRGPDPPRPWQRRQDTLGDVKSPSQRRIASKTHEFSLARAQNRVSYARA